ncbi:unnamed protein product [Amoebophrya sp. A120]|nr:unnamed protein product [Amoebophrya sp. A120]|eukprot:GSA120T00014896001.1
MMPATRTPVPGLPVSSEAGRTNRTLYVFRKTDLRLLDNRALAHARRLMAAAAARNESPTITFVVVLDVAQEWNRTGEVSLLASAGHQRRRFYRECCEDLEESLQKLEWLRNIQKNRITTTVKAGLPRYQTTTTASGKTSSASASAASEVVEDGDKKDNEDLVPRPRLSSQANSFFKDQSPRVSLELASNRNIKRLVKPPPGLEGEIDDLEARVASVQRETSKNSSSSSCANSCSTSGGLNTASSNNITQQPASSRNKMNTKNSRTPSTTSNIMQLPTVAGGAAGASSSLTTTTSSSSSPPDLLFCSELDFVSFLKEVHSFFDHIVCTKEVGVREDRLEKEAKEFCEEKLHVVMDDTMIAEEWFPFRLDFANTAKYISSYPQKYQNQWYSPPRHREMTYEDHRPRLTTISPAAQMRLGRTLPMMKDTYTGFRTYLEQNMDRDEQSHTLGVYQFVDRYCPDLALSLSAKEMESVYGARRDFGQPCLDSDGEPTQRLHMVHSNQWYNGQSPLDAVKNVLPQVFVTHAQLVQPEVVDESSGAATSTSGCSGHNNQVDALMIAAGRMNSAKNYKHSASATTARQTVGAGPPRVQKVFNTDYKLSKSTFALEPKTSMVMVPLDKILLENEPQLFFEFQDTLKMWPASSEENWKGVIGTVTEPPEAEDRRQCLAVGEDSVAGDDRYYYRGGERSGLKRLQYHFWETDLASTYKQTRNGSLGNEYSTKFSLSLSTGCVSPRTILHELAKYEIDRFRNDSTYWIVFELLWRDFLHFAIRKFHEKFFDEGGITGKLRSWESCTLRRDRNYLAWCKGETGIPFIDSAMKELKKTGFMSNRGRQNVASFLIYNLKIDWRFGAEYFEHALIDHDTAANYGNWLTIAGIGFQTRDNIFNVVKQSRQYEQTGAHMRYWLEKPMAEAKQVMLRIAREEKENNADGSPKLKPTALPLPDIEIRTYTKTSPPEPEQDKEDAFVLRMLYHTPWEIQDERIREKIPAVYKTPIIVPKDHFLYKVSDFAEDAPPVIVGRKAKKAYYALLAEAREQANKENEGLTTTDGENMEQQENQGTGENISSHQSGGTTTTASTAGGEKTPGGSSLKGEKIVVNADAEEERSRVNYQDKENNILGLHQQQVKTTSSSSALLTKTHSKTLTPTAGSTATSKTLAKNNNKGTAAAAAHEDFYNYSTKSKNKLHNHNYSGGNNRGGSSAGYNKATDSYNSYKNYEYPVGNATDHYDAWQYPGSSSSNHSYYNNKHSSSYYGTESNAGPSGGGGYYNGSSSTSYNKYHQNQHNNSSSYGATPNSWRTTSGGDPLGEHQRNYPTHLVSEERRRQMALQENWRAQQAQGWKQNQERFGNGKGGWNYNSSSTTSTGGASSSTPKEQTSLVSAGSTTSTNPSPGSSTAGSRGLRKVDALM